jgi:hypothetical protein
LVGGPQGEFEKRSIRGEPVKARDARRVALKFLEQARHPFLEVAGVEIRGVGGWTLDNICKADPEAREFSIMIGTKTVRAER